MTEEKTEEKTEQPKEPPRMTDEEKKKFFMAYLDGTVFTDRHVTEPADLGFVFMVLALAPVPQEYLEKCALIYEYMDQAAPLCINGMPSFLSCRFMHVDDWAELVPKLQQEIERRKQALEEV